MAVPAQRVGGLLKGAVCMGKKTTIKARILRLSIISILVLSILLVSLASILIFNAYDESYRK